MDKYFGIRFGLYLILFIVLGSTVLKLENMNDMVGPILLYLLPISLDYYTHNPIEEKDKKRAHKGFWGPFYMSCVFFALILTGVLQYITIDNVFLKILLILPCAYFVYLSARDWTIYSSKEEKIHRDLIKEISRSQEFEPPKKRVRNYKRLEAGKEF